MSGMEHRAALQPGASDTAPGELDDPDEKDRKNTAKPEAAAGTTVSTIIKDGVEVRKVNAPTNPYLYLSAKKLELKGGESIEDAMAIYRMAIHNGAKDRALEEAYLGLARCEYARGNYWQSFRAVESSYPQQFSRQALDQRARMEMDLAKLLLQRAGQPVEGALDKAGKQLNGYQTAATVFDAVVYNDPKGPFAPAALRQKAQCQKELQDYDEAAKTYYTLLNTYPHSPEVAEARLEQVELLALKTRNEGGIKGQQQDRVVEMLRKAKTEQKSDDPAYQEKIRQVEAQVQENQAGARLQEAKYYIKRGGGKAEAAAKFMLEDILRRYPGTKAVPEAQELLNKINGNKGGRSK